LTQLIKQIRTKCFDELKGRIKFSTEFKQLVVGNSKNICACCKHKLEDKFHIDHTKPLSNNGTNELSNLQALCIGCHMNKTANEQENGKSVKFADTEASFHEKESILTN
jgi:5-methylcytosine-specific restriction endonuclease McrA